VHDASAPGSRLRQLETENGRLREEVERLRQALRTPNELQAVIDAVPAMVGYWDAQLNNGFANAAYSSWFGLPVEQVRGMNLRAVLGEERYGLNLPYIEGALRGIPQRFERSFPPEDGRPGRESMADYIPDVVDGVVRGFAVHVADVTTLKRSEASLREREASLRALFALSPLGIVLTDPSGRFVQFNEAFRALCGYPEDELRALDYWTLTPTDYGAAEQEQLDALARTGRYGPYEKEYRCKNGTLVPLELHGLLLTADDGRQHIWSIVEDISVRKQHERELLRARDEAQAASHTKSAFLATMSHELRTPLNGILGMAQVLALSPRLDGDEQEQAQVILSSGQALLTQLNDILDFSKIEAGKLELTPGPFDPAALLEGQVRLFAATARERGLRLDTHWDAAHARSYSGDAVRLGQMLSNLVNNAIKFTDHGFVRVEARLLEEHPTQAVLEFSVEDSGVGVPLEKQAQLFAPFVQADTSNTRTHGGTGLGLSIVRKLAELMGGTAGFTSAPGKGSRSWFRVQVGLGEERGAAHHSSSLGVAVPLLSPALVLIVEDNSINRRVGEALLKRLGLRSVSHCDGAQALHALTHGLRPGLVLMDVQMPVMDGLTATRQLRAWEAQGGHARVPVVALTAGAYGADRQTCLEAGMDDFLTKPLRLEELTTTLLRWCGSRADGDGGST
jgi:PAS domain S-box-containing protein